jgi:hypothetical protein
MTNHGTCKFDLKLQGFQRNPLRFGAAGLNYTSKQLYEDVVLKKLSTEITK